MGGHGAVTDNFRGQRDVRTDQVIAGEGDVRWDFFRKSAEGRVVVGLQCRWLRTSAFGTNKGTEVTELVSIFLPSPLPSSPPMTPLR